MTGEHDVQRKADQVRVIRCCQSARSVIPIVEAIRDEWMIQLPPKIPLAL